MVRLGFLMLASVLLAARGAAAEPTTHHHATQAATRDDAADAADDGDAAAPALRPGSHVESDDDDRTVIRIDPVRTPLDKRVRNEFYFRAGPAYIDPRVATGGVQIVPTPLLSIAALPTTVAGSISSANGAIFASIIGFAPAALGGHVAFETILAYPSPTKFQASGPLATQSLAPSELGFPTGIPPLGSNIGQAMVAPVMATAVARLPLGPVTLYAGGGPSVLLVTDTKITNTVLTQVATPTFSVTPALGVVAQAGLDVQLWGPIHARVDFKELWFQTSQVTISNIQVHTTIPDLEVVNVGSVKSSITPNPIVLMAGAGASF